MLSFNRCFFVGFVVCSLMGFGSTPTFAWVDIAFYRFEEGTAGPTASGNGTILDSSGNGMNGTAMDRISYDDSSGLIKLYMNLVLGAKAVNSIRPLGILDSSYSPGIGIGNVQSPNYGQYFPGLIDDVRLSDQALRQYQFLSDFVVPEPSTSFYIGISMFLLHALKIRKRKRMYYFCKLTLARRLILQSLFAWFCIIGIPFENVKAVDYLYASDAANTISKYDLSSGNTAMISASVRTFGSGISKPDAMVFDNSGNLYVTSVEINSIYKIAPDESVSLFKTTHVNESFGLVFDATGNLYAANYGFVAGLDEGSIARIKPDGSADYLVITSEIYAPWGIAIDVSGVLYTANGDNTISKIAQDGSVSTFVASSQLARPQGLAFDKFGNLYAANPNNNSISKVTPSGSISQFAIGLNAPCSLVFDSVGYLYVGNSGDNTISKYDSNGKKLFSFNTGSKSPSFLAISNTVVPEPGSLNLVLIGAIVFSLHSFRKYRTKIYVHNFRVPMITFILMVVMCSEKTSYGWVDIVYGTGVLNDGASASFGSIDMHYQITAAKDYYTGEAIPLADQNSYPVDYPGIDSRFVNASDNARWICPAPVNMGFPIGWYTFSTIFDLTGHDPNTFSISGDWAMDNCSNGPSMLLNGIDTGNNLDITNESFLQLYPFTITSGFQTGLNTLDFVVFNWGGPTALLVSMQSSAAYSVPETSSVMMAAIGLLLITAMAMKRLYVPSGHRTDVCTT